MGRYRNYRARERRHHSEQANARALKHRDVTSLYVVSQLHVLPASSTRGRRPSFLRWDCTSAEKHWGSTH